MNVNPVPKDNLLNEILLGIDPQKLLRRNQGRTAVKLKGDNLYFCQLYFRFFHQ